MGMDIGLDVSKLFHEFFINGKTACRIKNHHISVVRLCGVHGIPGNMYGIGSGGHTVYRYIDLLT